MERKYICFVLAAALLTSLAAVSCGFDMDKEDFEFAEETGGGGNGGNCKAGATECVGNEVHICNKEGKLEFFEDCRKKDAVCEEGRCKSVICEKGSVFCENGKLVTCNESGTALIYQECPTGKTCISDDGAPRCG